MGRAGGPAPSRPHSRGGVMAGRLEELERRLERAEEALRNGPPWALQVPEVRSGPGADGTSLEVAPGVAEGVVPGAIVG